MKKRVFTSWESCSCTDCISFHFSFLIMPFYPHFFLLITVLLVNHAFLFPRTLSIFIIFHHALLSYSSGFYLLDSFLLVSLFPWGSLLLILYPLGPHLTPLDLFAESNCIMYVCRLKLQNFSISWWFRPR